MLALLLARSGLALCCGIVAGAGVIDAGYRGNVGVILFNLGDSDFQVRTGDRIAQLILERIILPSVEEVEQMPDSGQRGTAGFGSTGVAADTAANKTHHDEEPGPAASSGSTKRPRDSPAT